ncbi:hypothetical protein HMPREF0971_01964 [Segatella oris F0302]|uniref:Uncharacterized protein n=1 Tax=Segatella oris F0302 TaxID=649760 RepID=D1QSK5_9BACT|nr:hypothetical protein HMPREF0971_01964 [Segatella oris F0302]
MTQITLPFASECAMKWGIMHGDLMQVTRFFSVILSRYLPLNS